MTYNFAWQLTCHERKQHAETFGVLEFTPSNQWDPDESDLPDSSDDKWERLLVNPHWIWSKERRVWLLGTLQRAHEARI